MGKRNQALHTGAKFVDWGWLNNTQHETRTMPVACFFAGGPSVLPLLDWRLMLGSPMPAQQTGGKGGGGGGYVSANMRGAQQG